MSALMQIPPQQLAAPRRLRPLRPSVFRAHSDPDRGWSPFAPKLGDVPQEELSREARRASYLAHRNPSSPTAWARLAQAELVEGQLDRAADAARATLSALANTAPDEAAHLAATLTLAAAAGPDEAESGFTRFDWRDGPTAILAAALAAERHDFDEARTRLEGQHSASAWNLRGWIALQEDEYAEAIRAYRRAISLVGPTPESLTNRGLAQAALGRLDKAIRDTRQALALHPSNRERVVFNLVSYLVSRGDADEALAVVTELMRAEPSAEGVFVLARLHLGTGDANGAHRVLRRARTRMWASLDPDSQAELDANLAFVRGELGQIGRNQVADDLTSALKRTSFRSRRIASLLPLVLTKFSNRDRLREIVASMREVHGSSPLYELEAHLAILERRFTDAVEIAVDWSQASFLDPEPASLAVYLLCDVEQDCDRAVQLGVDALERMPNAKKLAHNVSYALALVGDPMRARTWLLDDLASVPTLATLGLVLLREGRADEAKAEYERALQSALESDDGVLALLVDMHARFAFARFAQSSSWEAPDLEPNPAWLDEPRVAIAARMLENGGVALPQFLVELGD